MRGVLHNALLAVHHARPMAGCISAGTERAIRRHLADGEPVTQAARAESISPSTLFRALRRRVDAGVRRRVVIAGAGALGREIMGWLRVEDKADGLAFLSDVPAPGLNVIGRMDGFAPEPGDEVLIALGDPEQRERCAKRLGMPSASYVARTATVAQDATIGPGCLVLPHAIVSANAQLGRGVLVNVCSSIGHDVVLGDWCTLSAHVDLTGRVQVGRSVFFGSGARVVPGVRIGDGATIGAGAVVLHDVREGATVFGNPARGIA